jgi:SAM-dependent methyltransferase
VSSATVCDLCGSEQSERLFDSPDRRFGVNGVFAIVRCSNCGLVRTDPQPQDLASFYPAELYYSYQAPQASALTRATVRRAYGVPVRGAKLRAAAALSGARIGGLPPGPPGDLLDVGCGSGSMLLALEEAGWRCHGIEIDEGAVAAANEAGLTRVRAGDLLAADYPDASMDAVRFWHSLEHVRSPRAQLERARRILRPGGTLTIGVPNFGSLLSRLFRNRWFFLDVPRHLWHLERKQLRELVTSSGFTVTRIRNVTASSAILGTLDYLLGRREVLVSRPLLWYATQPFAALLDVLRVGDELELTATPAVNP